MKPSLATLLRIYGVLLRLYPDEIRQRWEPEIAEAFALQLADSWQDARWRGVLQVCFCAVAELIHIALLRRVVAASIMISLVSLASSGAILFSLTWVLANSLVLGGWYRQLVTKLGG